MHRITSQVPVKEMFVGCWSITRDLYRYRGDRYSGDRDIDDCKEQHMTLAVDETEGSEFSQVGRRSIAQNMFQQELVFNCGEWLFCSKVAHPSRANYRTTRTNKQWFNCRDSQQLGPFLPECM
jgi:hypothetical protein